MKPYLFLGLSILTNIVGQVILKTGANQLQATQDLLHKIFNPYIIGGLALYMFGALFWILALTKLELSLAYPLLSLSYIGIALVSFFIFREPLTLTKMVGIAIIMCGVFILNR